MENERGITMSQVKVYGIRGHLEVRTQLSETIRNYIVEALY